MYHVITAVRKSWPIGSVYQHLSRVGGGNGSCVESFPLLFISKRIFRLYYTHQRHSPSFFHSVFCLRFVIVMIQLAVTLGSGHGKWKNISLEFSPSRDILGTVPDLSFDNLGVFRLPLTNFVVKYKTGCFVWFFPSLLLTVLVLSVQALNIYTAFLNVEEKKDNVCK